MALIKCPECSKEISDKATMCPNCGFPISKINKTTEKEYNNEYKPSLIDILNIFLGYYPNKNIVCPHCHKKGGVFIKKVSKDMGISSKKTTAAWLTGGLSLLFTGLSRKEIVTKAYCKNCGSKWTF